MRFTKNGIARRDPKGEKNPQEGIAINGSASLSSSDGWRGYRSLPQPALPGTDRARRLPDDTMGAASMSTESCRATETPLAIRA
jgi:hypothetical protein